MKRIRTCLFTGLSVFLLISFLSGCGQAEEPGPDSDLFSPITEPTPATGNADDGAGNSTAPDGASSTASEMVRSRLTNEWVDEAAANVRPVAIMIPNTKTASQYGLSQASILYECNIEVSMTRLMGIWDNWQDLEKIGNIRSIRDYFVYWALEWDAVLIHFGGPFYTNEILSKEDTQSINCLTYANGFYRAAAKNSTDNAFTDSTLIRKAMERYQYPESYREEYLEKNHYQFVDSSTPNNLTQYPDAIVANTIDLSPAYPVTNCYFKYNRETGLYDRYQHLSGEEDGPHIDLANGEQLAFKNVLIQNTYFEQRDQQGYLAFQCHDDTRDGWFFTNGRGIHVTWEKNGDYEATRYYDDLGYEINLNTGKTMVCILEDGDSFIVDRQKIGAE